MYQNSIKVGIINVKVNLFLIVATVPIIIKFRVYVCYQRSRGGDLVSITSCMAHWVGGITACECMGAVAGEKLSRNKCGADSVQYVNIGPTTVFVGSDSVE